jgi:hypothetical protein
MKQKIGVMNGRAIKFAFRNGEDVGHLDELRLRRASACESETPRSPKTLCLEMERGPADRLVRNHDPVHGRMQ